MKYGMEDEYSIFKVHISDRDGEAKQDEMFIKFAKAAKICGTFWPFRPKAEFSQIEPWAP